MYLFFIKKIIHPPHPFFFFSSNPSTYNGIFIAAVSTAAMLYIDRNIVILAAYNTENMYNFLNSTESISKLSLLVEV